MGSDYRVLDFVEKPKDNKIIEEFEIPGELREKGNGREEEKTHVGSMGIYLFNKEVLLEILKTHNHADFGKQIIPAAISNCNVYAYPFSGYWEDIGTIKAFFDAHMGLTAKDPPFNFYDQEKPIFTRARFLPAAKFSGQAAIDSSIICEGSVIDNAMISESIIGVRSIIGGGSRLTRTILMGADYYDFEDAKKHESFGIGKNCRIRNAIIDKDVSIGDDVQLENLKNLQNAEQDGITIRDGIIVVPKGMRVPAGYVL
jgi:glucose-1-phosphate adenylyltransferase